MKQEGNIKYQGGKSDTKKVSPSRLENIMIFKELINIGRLQINSFLTWTLKTNESKYYELLNVVITKIQSNNLLPNLSTAENSKNAEGLSACSAFSAV